jgi:hypothetical protein
MQQLQTSHLFLELMQFLLRPLPLLGLRGKTRLQFLLLVLDLSVRSVGPLQLLLRTLQLMGRLQLLSLQVSNVCLKARAFCF